MIWRGQPWRSAGFDVMYNWVGFTVNRIVAIDIIKSFIHICLCFYSTVCFLVRYLFRLLLSLGKTITFSPSLCRHFSIFYQWKQKHAIMNSSNDFGFGKYLILSTTIEQKVRILFSFLFFFLIIKGALWVIYISRNRICFTHNTNKW